MQQTRLDTTNKVVSFWSFSTLWSVHCIRFDEHLWNVSLRSWLQFWINTWSAPHCPCFSSYENNYKPHCNALYGGLTWPEIKAWSLQPPHRPCLSSPTWKWGLLPYSLFPWSKSWTSFRQFRHEHGQKPLVILTRPRVGIYGAVHLGARQCGNKQLESTTWVVNNVIINIAIANIVNFVITNKSINQCNVTTNKQP